MRMLYYILRNLVIKMHDVNILAIESSCDETSVSIVRNGCEEISTVVSASFEGDDGK